MSPRPSLTSVLAFRFGRGVPQAGKLFTCVNVARNTSHKHKIKHTGETAPINGDIRRVLYVDLTVSPNLRKGRGNRQWSEVWTKSKCTVRADSCPS